MFKILYLSSLIRNKGYTDRLLEYFGKGLIYDVKTG